MSDICYGGGHATRNCGPGVLPEHKLAALLTHGGKSLRIGEQLDYLCR
jgi:hypothetical protein